MNTPIRTISAVAVVGLLIAGCGDADDPGASPETGKERDAHTLEVQVRGDIGTTRAASAAEAEDTCNAIQAGDLEIDRRLRQVSFHLPKSGGRDYTCMVP